MDTMRRINRFRLNATVRLHGFTRKGTVTKRPADRRTYRVQGVRFEPCGTPSYDLLCEEDGTEHARIWEYVLSAA